METWVGNEQDNEKTAAGELPSAPTPGGNTLLPVHPLSGNSVVSITCNDEKNQWNFIAGNDARLSYRSRKTLMIQDRNPQETMNL